jgi:magnesium chelatase family protein
MTAMEIREFCALEREAQGLLRTAMERFHLSARAFHRIVKLARTIADLSGSDTIETPHLAEALQYRPRG